jgi:hypothetical protein
MTERWVSGARIGRGFIADGMPGLVKRIEGVVGDGDEVERADRDARIDREGLRGVRFVERLPVHRGRRERRPVRGGAVLLEVFLLERLHLETEIGGREEERDERMKRSTSGEREHGPGDGTGDGPG